MAQLASRAGLHFGRQIAAKVGETLTHQALKPIVKEGTATLVKRMDSPLAEAIGEFVGKPAQQNYQTAFKTVGFANTFNNQRDKINDFARQVGYQQGTFAPDLTGNQFSHGGIKRRSRRRHRNRKSRSRRNRKRQRQTNKSRR